MVHYIILTVIVILPFISVCTLTFGTKLLDRSLWGYGRSKHETTKEDTKLRLWWMGFYFIISTICGVLPSLLLVQIFNLHN